MPDEFFPPEMAVSRLRPVMSSFYVHAFFCWQLSYAEYDGNLVYEII